MNGILIIDKPEGMTSHDVVLTIRKRFRSSKVGHFGTLDPMATGVLPIALGKATRLGQFISSSPKVYEGSMRFGFATNTYDRNGTPTTEERPLEGNVEEAMQSLIGTLDQVPPPFSAKKIGGVPSYKLARKNRTIEIPASRVQIERFDLMEFNAPWMTFRVVCSPGTYIRSLAHDLGQRLGCGAHLTALHRTQSGDFRIENAQPLDTCSASNIIPVESLLSSIPMIEVSGTEETRVLHGNEIQAAVNAPLARIFNKKGEFIAVAAVENGWVRPRLVLT
jgi:tRNA pseudouridine55 synthase